ncbi:hypothetical protein [Flagellimonas sp.]|uniref:hypothetical protein n=1 Tax=Flagellimonas sp. TaxID=2058762 RepID=UPI003BAB8BD9
MGNPEKSERNQVSRCKPQILPLTNTTERGKFSPNHKLYSFIFREKHLDFIELNALFLEKGEYGHLN